MHFHQPRLNNTRHAWLAWPCWEAAEGLICTCLPETPQGAGGGYLASHPHHGCIVWLRMKMLPALLAGIALLVGCGDGTDDHDVLNDLDDPKPLDKILGGALPEESVQKRGPRGEQLVLVGRERAEVGGRHLEARGGVPKLIQPRVGRQNRRSPRIAASVHPAIQSYTRHSGTLTHPHFWGSIAAVRRLNGFLGSGVDSPPAAPHREGIAVGERGNWCRWEGWDSQPPVEGGAGVPWGLSRQDSAPRTSSSRKRFRQRWCNLRHPSSSGRVGRARHSVSPARKSVLYDVRLTNSPRLYNSPNELC